jgi:hypothetical protein
MRDTENGVLLNYWLWVFKTYIGGWAWQSIGDRLKGPCNLSREELDSKTKDLKQRTDIGKYCYVNRTIKLWNQLPAEALATFPCKPHIFRRGLGK